MKTTRTTILLPILVGLAAGGCSLDVPDLNNPGIDSLENNPTPSAVEAACTGLIIGNRRNVAQENGYVMQLGILGREAYNFDQADPRYIDEMLKGKLNPGSPFGGNFWALPYANIKLGDIILDASQKVADFTAEDKAAITGFVKTIQALDLYEVVMTRDSNGAVIDVPKTLDQTLPPIVDKNAAYARIDMLLDDGAAALDNAGTTFPFALSKGYTGFDTPATFKQFNRAIRARVAVFQGDYATALQALSESFVDPTADLKLGVYHTFSTASGDVANGLVNPNIYVSAIITAEAKPGDTRFTTKTSPTGMTGTAEMLTSDRVFTLYSTPTSPVPIITNEELLLLRAEAEHFAGGTGSGDDAAALADLNVVQTAAGLPALATFTMADLQYNRDMSLLFTGGFRWIDHRRFNIPLETTDQGVTFEQNVRYPIPLTECNARPGEPRCMLGSTP